MQGLPGGWQAALRTREMRWVMRIMYNAYVKHHSSICSPSRQAGRAYPVPGWDSKSEALALDTNVKGRLKKLVIEG